MCTLAAARNREPYAINTSVLYILYYERLRAGVKNFNTLFAFVRPFTIYINIVHYIFS